MEEASTTRLTIFHTGDMHGNLEAMPRLSHLARRLRREAEAQGRQTLYFDAGDAADRRIRICSLSKGEAFYPILNAMGYDLQTVGNAISLPYGPQAIAPLARRANFPLLAANLRDGDGPLVEGVQAWVPLRLQNGLRLGVAGLTAPWGNLYELFGLHLPDWIPLARRLVSEMKAAGVNVVIFLAHLGKDDEERLADEVEGIDVIIGAHSHDRLPDGMVRNGVWMARAGEYAQALGQLDLTLEARTGRVLAGQARVWDVPAEEPEDPAVLEAIAAAEAEIGQRMAQPAGEAQAELGLDETAESALGNLAADALRERMQAEIALIYSGHFRQGLPAGPLTVGQVNEATFSPANPAVVNVTGSQLTAALEQALDPELRQYRHHGLRGAAYGWPQVSGMQVVYDPQGETGRRIRAVRVHGEALQPERVYRLASTDGELSPRCYFRDGSLQDPHYEVPTIMVEVLLNYVRAHSPVPAPVGGRWVAEASR